MALCGRVRVAGKERKDVGGGARLPGGSRTGLGRPIMCQRRAAPIGCTAIGSEWVWRGTKKKRCINWCGLRHWDGHLSGVRWVCGFGLAGGTTVPPTINLSWLFVLGKCALRAALCHVWRAAASAWGSSRVAD